MEERSANNWSDFEALLTELAEGREKRKAEHEPLHIPPLLFRGFANSDWVLESTLYRLVRDMTIEQYYLHVLRAKPTVESVIGTSWNVLDVEIFRKWHETHNDAIIRELPGYEFIVYLRHHGFPSPLLDWSASPYVAAFFAFSQVVQDADSVCVYCFASDIGHGRASRGGQTRITPLSHFVASHKRHFLQQSRYSIATVERGNTVLFTSHADVFERDNPKQDQLVKISMPSAKRSEFLRQLNLYNINSYSLFGSEDSLIDTVATREFTIDE